MNRRGTIFSPGRNCWRVERAARAAVLIDGAAYFAHLEQALRRARRSIFIAGWDFDGHIRFRPRCSAEASPPLGPLLRTLAESNSQLEIRILVWNIGAAFAPGDAKQLIIGADWQDHARVALKLDSYHPLQSAHHQKFVVIDDAFAFAGGIDLTVERWDTPAHEANDPLRCMPDGEAYGPVHDLMLAVDGEPAAAIAQLARQRWQAATGEATPFQSGGDREMWPETLAPDFRDTPVAIARTLPPMGDQAPVREAAALTADALAGARRAIYLEQQYLTAPFVGDILARHLAREDGPDVVLIITQRSHGFVEHFIMGENRDRLIRRLKRYDRYGRLRAFYPCVAGPDGERRQVLIHSKLIIVDDTFIRIGSSNLNNRSIGLDSECDLAIEAQDAQAAKSITAIRDRLLAEHLDAEPAEIAATVEAEGSLVRAIDKLNRKERGLEPFPALEGAGPARPVWGTRLLDPKQPFEPFWFLRRRKPKAPQPEPRSA